MIFSCFHDFVATTRLLVCCVEYGWGYTIENVRDVLVYVETIDKRVVGILTNRRCT